VLCCTHLRRRAHHPEIFAVPPYLPRHVLVPVTPRYIGFLNFNRRLLAMGAVVASGALTAIYAMPASAEVVKEEVQVSTLQSFVAPSAPHRRVIRDSFGVTEYTLVQWPVPSTTELSSGFGFRSCDGCSSNHLGIDLNPGNGYPVQAVADGVVVYAGEDSVLGVHVIIEHSVNGQIVRSLYGHMQWGSTTVALGDTVARGQQLGVVGSTGSSTGPHLHFGILIDGVEVDPLPWLQSNANS
jgi:murein DD-endopeptidase MepM/ murein hydrolase activator NlpD